MLYLKIKTFLLSLTWVLIFQTVISTHPVFGGNNVLMKDFSPETIDDPGTKSKSHGYRSIVRYDDGFVAAGSGGRIDWITASGKIVKSEKVGEENFNCLFIQNNDMIVAGERGAIINLSEKGTFRKIKSGSDKNINCIALLKGRIIAGTDEGEILSGDLAGSFSKIYFGVKGNIVSLSARNEDCFGVTDQGEIIRTTNGTNWDIFDFNQVYKGFYKACAFKSVLATEKGIAVAGVYDDGLPLFMFSTLGKVWSERPLVYKNGQGIQELLTDQPTGIFYDDIRDNFYLVCKGGMLMKLPSCSHCNELAELPEVFLTGISGMNEMLMIVGDDFYLKSINL